MTQCVDRCNRNWSVMSLIPIKGSHCFLELETKTTLLDWYQLVLLVPEKDYECDIHKQILLVLLSK